MHRDSAVDSLQEICIMSRWETHMGLSTTYRRTVSRASLVGSYYWVMQFCWTQHFYRQIDGRGRKIIPCVWCTIRITYKMDNRGAFTFKLAMDTRLLSWTRLRRKSRHITSTTCIYIYIYMMDLTVTVNRRGILYWKSSLSCFAAKTVSYTRWWAPKDRMYHILTVYLRA